LSIVGGLKFLFDIVLTAFVYLLITEHTEDELGDYKAWFEIFSRKSSVREVCNLSVSLAYLLGFLTFLMYYIMLNNHFYNRTKEQHLRILK